MKEHARVEEARCDPAPLNDHALGQVLWSEDAPHKRCAEMVNGVATLESIIKNCVSAAGLDWNSDLLIFLEPVVNTCYSSETFSAPYILLITPSPKTRRSAAPDRPSRCCHIDRCGSRVAASLLPFAALECLGYPRKDKRDCVASWFAEIGHTINLQNERCWT